MLFDLKIDVQNLCGNLNPEFEKIFNYMQLQISKLAGKHGICMSQKQDSFAAPILLLILLGERGVLPHHREHKDVIPRDW